MSRMIDYDPQRKLLLIQFPYDRWLVEVVKGLPGRRWDAIGRVWVLPATHFAQTMRALGEYEFELTGEAAALLAASPAPAQPPATPPQGAPAAAHAEAPLTQAAAPQPQAPATPPRPSPQTAMERAMALVEGLLPTADASPQTLRADSANTFTVSAINQRARQVLRAAFPDAFWVVGELSGYNRGKERRFLSFELIERPTPESDPTAHIQAVVWADGRAQIDQRLQASSDGFSLQDGLQVRLRVSVDLYPEYGKFQLIVQDIDPAYTLNQIAVRRDEILRQLTAQGLLERNRALPMPWLPLRVALITSPQGEALQDFLHELARSHIGFDVSLFGVRVQGPKLAPELTAALATIRRHAARFDAVVIIRGGGSRADLAWFDHLDIALAVATCPLKVIVGIGHQRDQSVLDLIAHSEKTPTAAAERLVRGVEDAAHQQDALLQMILSRAQETLAAASSSLERHATTLAAAFRRRLSQSNHDLTRAQTLLVSTSDRRLQRAQEALDASSHHLHVGARVCLRAEARALDALQARLSSRHLPSRLLRAQDTLADAQRRLQQRALLPMRALRLQLDALDLRRRLLDPLTVMARGYARVTTSTGQPLTSTHQPSPGDTLKVRLRDGFLLTSIDEIHPHDRPEQPILPRGDAGAEAHPRRDRRRRHRP
jgi:exodeoxyribonuclease VII large subunit